MIKLLFAVIAIQSAWCAPQGLPFTQYGPPGGVNLAETSFPSAPAPGPQEVLEKLPETLQTPKYNYNQGSFPLPSDLHSSYGIPEVSPAHNQPSFEEAQPDSHFSHPHPEQEETGTEIKETEIPPGSNIPEHPVPGSGDSIFEEESLGSSLSPASTQNLKPVPGPKPGPAPAAQINIPPNTSIKVQDNRGQYSHGFSNPDGTQVEESGHLISTDNGWEYVIAKEGSYSYNSPEGIPIKVRYIADENGFRILSTSFAGR